MVFIIHLNSDAFSISFECSFTFLIRNYKNELNIYLSPCSFLEYLAEAGVGLDENMQTKIHYSWSADASALWTEPPT